MKKMLLSELLNRKTPVIVTELARLINKTGRTVRSYLEEIENEYRQYNIELIRKSNVGVYLKISDSDRARLKASIQETSSKNTEEEGLYSRFRQMYIIKTLLEDQFAYTIQLFADELYCSKGTIVNDLIYVQDWLDKYNLILKKKQNKGLWIEGTEKDYRRALKGMLDEVDKNETENNISDEDIEKLDYRIDLINYKKLKKMFAQTDFYFIQDIIQQAEKELGFYFTDQAFLNLITHIAITIERVKSDKALSMGENYIESFRNKREFKVAEWIVEQLSNKFHISFPEGEVGYITLHILGAKVQENYDAAQYDDIIGNENNEYIDIANDIIAMASEILNVDLKQDKGLVSRLVLHLRPTIMRLKYGLKLSNPMLERIKQEYTSIFGAAWACSSIFEKRLGITINEDEVGYIALHLALSYERAKGKIKTVVVCSSGIGTSQMVASELSKKYNNLDITHIIPLNLLSQELIDNSDLIISTVRSSIKSDKIVYISAIVGEKDSMKIDEAIKRIRFSVGNTAFRHSETENIQQETVSIFEKDLCFIDNDIKDYVQAITYYGRLMENKGYAKEGFYKNILEREKKGSTYIGKGIAIPHAEDTYVNKSKVCIVRFSEPVIWNENKLDFIFILCLKFEDIDKTKKFFKSFYSVLKDDGMLERMRNSQSKDQILNIFTEGGHNNG